MFLFLEEGLGRFRFWGFGFCGFVEGCSWQTVRGCVVSREESWIKSDVERKVVVHVLRMDLKKVVARSGHENHLITKDEIVEVDHRGLIFSKFSIGAGCGDFR